MMRRPRPCSTSGGAARVLRQHPGVGFDAETVRQANRIKRLKGVAVYLAAIYRTFLSFGRRCSESRAASTRNGAHDDAGGVHRHLRRGAFYLAPQADPQDGLLDVCLIRKVGLMTFLRPCPKVMRGTHTSLNEVALFRTDAVSIRSPNGVPLVSIWTASCASWGRRDHGHDRAAAAAGAGGTMRQGIGRCLRTRRSPVRRAARRAESHHADTNRARNRFGPRRAQVRHDSIRRGLRSRRRRVSRSLVLPGWGQAGSTQLTAGVFITFEAIARHDGGSRAGS